MSEPAMDFHQFSAPFFVGHAFSDKQRDDLRNAIALAVKQEDKFLLRPVYADEVLGMGHILEKIKRLIATSLFCVFDLTHPRPNIFFELGYAQGIGKPHILIAEAGSDIPTDLAGYEIIFYRSYVDLQAQLKHRIPDIVKLVAQFLPKTHVAHVDLMDAILECTKAGPVSLSEMVKAASALGFVEEDVTRAIHLFLGKAIERRGRKFIVTAKGRQILEHLVTQMRSQGGV